jgi:hypothetical protein
MSILSRLAITREILAENRSIADVTPIPSIKERRFFNAETIFSSAEKVSATAF